MKKEENKILTNLAKRINPNCILWFNCSLQPRVGDLWNCYVCNKEFSFKKQIKEIDEHGYSHFKEHNLIIFI